MDLLTFVRTGCHSSSWKHLGKKNYRLVQAINQSLRYRYGLIVPVRVDVDDNDFFVGNKLMWLEELHINLTTISVIELPGGLIDGH
jgi:hypothetical protein